MSRGWAWVVLAAGCSSSSAAAVVDGADAGVDSGPCVELYADKDGDGYGAGPKVTVCGSTTGYSERSGDCADNDPRAYPGASAWQAEGIADGGGFDFNCDGREEQEPQPAELCYLEDDGGCSAAGGWNDPAPTKCGQGGQTVDTCRPIGGKCYGVGPIVGRYLRCR